MKLISLLVVAFASFVICPSSAHAQYGSTINPADYESPSGRHRMHVEPSDRRGEKHCEVSMFSNGTRVWKQTIEPTLWLAGVTDDGQAFGIGYIHDFPDPEFPRRRGEVTLMQIIKIDTDGQTTVIAEQECRSARSSTPCGTNFSKIPFASRMAIQPGADSLVVSAFLGPNENYRQAWWRYNLSDGSKVGTADPIEDLKDDPGHLREIEIAPIPSTPLILAQWSKSGWVNEATKYTTMIGVCTTDGVMHWQREYEAADDSESIGRRQSREASRPEIKYRPGGFTVTTPDKQETSTYLCAPGRSTGAWSVVAVDRVVNEAPAPSDAAASEPDLARVVGTITLDSFRTEKTPFWKIVDFDIDQNNTIGFLRRAVSNKIHLTLSNIEGDILCDRPLPEIDNAYAWQLAALSGGRWLVCCTNSDKGEPSVFFYNPRDDTFKPPYRWAGGSLREPIGLPDGGFLGFAGSDSYSANRLTSFDRLGRERWRADCFSPEDIIVDQSGRILVLENISNKIRYFSVDGKELKAVDLEKATGAEMHYPTNLVPLNDGGVICFDYPSDEPFIRLDNNGELVERFRPQHEDGWSFKHYYTIRSTPDGSFWISDGSSLIQTDENGVWTRMLGDPPWEAPLREIGAMALGPGDTPHVVNARNHAAHVFDADGHERAVLMPEPSLFSTRMNTDAITVGGNGAVRFGISDIGSGKFESFDHAGVRLASTDDGSVFATKGDWRFIPDSNERWQIHNRSIRRLNDDGAVEVEIDRTYKGDWLGYIRGIAIARDGSVAMTSSQEQPGRNDYVTSVYQRDGTPIGAVDHGFDNSFYSSIAYAPPFVIFSQEDRIRFVHESGQVSPRELVLPFDDQSDHQHYRQLLIPERAGELWVWCSCSPQITRVAFPD